jgi:hypothetical protein
MLERTLNSIQSEVDLYIQSIHTDVFSKLDANKICICDYQGRENTQEYITLKAWGVYVFYVTPLRNINTLAELNELWHGNFDSSILKIPSVITKRFSPLFAGNEYCFYVGKSEELDCRIAQHIHQATAPSTSGLKLSHHTNLLSCCHFSYSFYSIETNPQNNLDALKFLTVSLERHLRNHLRPLIGKQ